MSKEVRENLIKIFKRFAGSSGTMTASDMAEAAEALITIDCQGRIIKEISPGFRKSIKAPHKQAEKLCNALNEELRVILQNELGDAGRFSLLASEQWPHIQHLRDTLRLAQEVRDRLEMGAIPPPTAEGYKPRERLVAEAVRLLFEELTGEKAKAPTWHADPDPKKREYTNGPYRDFLGEVFCALGIEASANSWAVKTANTRKK
ncbi:hypothetical protein FF098_006820 [Parvularcula flava]|uniref:Uncharacterized protein n=1 Tax=Aquisalinus luteolus TaxID=1566827 RepID=A0A8J3EPB0_9PROT|nr:hypothetical protein [Aquisalinus luteolus]NHK27610.1 hypothetical protein [Aquisalinus luteolus]GGH95957.1 hypothetical protein GCM10011355_13730 [Aquisalinus luteolus]